LVFGLGQTISKQFLLLDIKTTKRLR